MSDPKGKLLDIGRFSIYWLGPLNWEEHEYGRTPAACGCWIFNLGAIELTWLGDECYYAEKNT